MRINLIAGAVLASMVLGGMRCGAALVGDATSTVLEANLIGKVHFVGTTQLQTDKTADSVNELGALSASAALRDHLLDALARAPFRALRSHFPAGSPDFAGRFRPLFEDLTRLESYAEMRDATNPVPEVMFAVRVDKQRSEFWRTNLATVFSTWTGISVRDIQADGYPGWELKKHHDPNLIRLIQAGDWVVLGWGWNDLLLQSSFLQRIRANGRPVEVSKGIWLDAWMDWPAYQPYHHLPLPGGLPKMHLTLEGLQTLVRPKLVMQFPQPLGMKLDAWQIPTNTASGPFVSFSVGRGIAPWVERIPVIRDLKITPTPNQFTAWASAQGPFESFLAIPEPKASNLLERIQPALISLLNSNFTSEFAGTTAIWTTNHEILVTHFPFVHPNLTAVHEGAGDFFLAGVFATPHTNSPPPEDLMQLIHSRSNMVYYSGENTRERLRQLRPLIQLVFMASQAPLPDSDTPAQKWLIDNGPKLEQCGTVITLTAPNELTFVRNSTIGLSAAELIGLAHLLDAPGFPLNFHYLTGEEWYNQELKREQEKAAKPAGPEKPGKK